MNDIRQTTLDKLNELGIQYKVIEHPAVFTIEEMESLYLIDKNYIAKNLFLRDDKKSRYILLILSNDKKVNLKDLSLKIKSRPLSFASEECLKKYLGLSKGSVTPLGIINDDLRRVEVMIDRSLLSNKLIGVHPNDNAATVFISMEDLAFIITNHGNKLDYFDI